MRNWTIKEAVEEINKGNQVAIDEVAKHYPMAFMAIVKNDLVGLSQLMGDKFTLNRLAKQVSDDVEEDAENETMNPPATEAKTAKVNKKEEATEASGDDLESMTTKQLMQLCDKRGIKVPHYGKNKQFYLEQLQGGASADDEAEAETEAEEEDAYEGKSAVELFKECKKRGIKADQKKPAKYYIGLLKKADEAAAEEDEAEDEDWEDEAEEEAPAKPAKATKPAKEEKKSAKPAKATKKEAEAEDEDGDDWDI